MSGPKELWITISLDIVNCRITLISCGETRKECDDRFKSINVEELEGEDKIKVEEAIDSPYIKTFKTMSFDEGCDPRQDAIDFRDNVGEWLVSCGVARSDAIEIIKGIGTGIRKIVEEKED